MTHSRLEGELSDRGRQVVELTVPELVVGRRADSALVLNDAHVSRQGPGPSKTPCFESMKSACFGGHFRVLMGLGYRLSWLAKRPS